MDSKDKLERIAANAERAAALDERDRRLAMLILNGHLTKPKRRKGRCTTD